MQLVPDNSVYNVAECLRVDGDLDTGLFEAAARQAVAKAGAVRIRLSQQDDSPRQRMADPDAWELPHVDVSGAADPEAAAVEWMQADMRRPVDLRDGPLFTVALFTIAPGRFLWYQRAHHIAMDGFSGLMYAERVAGIYTTLAAGASPADGALPPFAVLAEADAAYRASADFGADREFWAGSLAGFTGAAAGDRAERAGGGGGRGVPGPVHGRGRRGGGRFGAGAARPGAADTGDDGQRGPSAAAAGRAADGRRTGPAGVGRGPGGAAAPAVPGRGHRRDLRLAAGRTLSSLIVNVMAFDYELPLAGCRVAPFRSFGWAVADARISLSGGPGGTARIAADVNPDLYDAAAGQELGHRFRRAHQPGVFRGPALLLVAAEGNPPGAAPWTPHITGQVTEVPLACTHAGMVRPATMAQVWSAISAWSALTAEIRT